MTKAGPEQGRSSRNLQLFASILANLAPASILKYERPGAEHFTSPPEDFTLDVTGCRPPADPLRINESL
jgi:hypothetical protein